MSRHTPETDAVASIEGNWDTKALRMTAHSRKLEQERDEARKALKHIEEYGTEEINAAVELRQKFASALVERDEAITRRMETIMQCELYEQERNEARELLESEKITRNHIIQRGIEMQKERDEAREAVKYWEELCEKLSPY